MSALDPEALRALSDRLAQGDAEALEQVFKAFGGMALAVALRVLKDRAEAQEVVQESFVQMWKTATRYEPQRASLGAWILSIVKSRALDRLRANGAQARMAMSLEQQVNGVSDVPSPFEQLQTRRAVHQMQGLLSALPKEQREALELAYFQGLSHQEISTRTALPLGTVKTRVRRATQTLAEMLK